MRFHLKADACFDAENQADALLQLERLFNAAQANQNTHLFDRGGAQLRCVDKAPRPLDLSL